jgi:hypothetical protein
VLITGTTDGLPLVYENSTSLWKNKKLTSAGLENNSVGTSQLKDGETTFAKIQDIGTGQLLGRASVGTGDVEGLTLGAGFLLDAFTQELLLDAGPARTELGLATTDSVKFATVSLANDEFISNSTNGRIELRPSPTGSTLHGFYTDFLTASKVRIGTIQSTTNSPNLVPLESATDFDIAGGYAFGLGNQAARFWYMQLGNPSTTLGRLVFTTTVNNVDHTGAFVFGGIGAQNSANRSPTTAHANPTVYVYAGGTANANDFARLSHDATNATLESGRGKMVVKGASTVRIEGPSGGFDLPATAGSNGQVLTTDGTNASW